MGYSATAKIFYGFDLPEDFNDDCWDERFAAYYGVVDDSGLFTKEGSYAIPKGTEQFTIANKKNDEYLKKMRELVKACPVGIDFHGVDDSLTSCVIYKATLQRVDWGDSEEIRPLSPQDDTEMKKFCEAMGIEFKKPTWRVAAQYF